MVWQEAHRQAFALERAWPTACSSDSIVIDVDLRPRAYVVITSVYGAVEMEIAGLEDLALVGVLFIPCGPLAVGDALDLKVLCRSNDGMPAAHTHSSPQELRVQVIAIDGVRHAGHRQPAVPGLEIEVAFETAVDDVLDEVFVSRADVPR